MDKGAIPLVKSNIPAGLMCFDSGNYVWGLAKNPWNENRSIGGSSGGEAGLVSTHGSPIGLGTDIGGSIRTPCAYGGCYGIKPTPSRTSLAGGVSDIDGDGVFILLLSFILLLVFYVNLVIDSFRANW